MTDEVTRTAKAMVESFGKGALDRAVEIERTAQDQLFAKAVRLEILNLLNKQTRLTKKD